MNTHSHSLEISRRAALQKLSCGFGNLALLSLMQNNASAVAPASSISPLAPKQSHFPAKAKRVFGWQATTAFPDLVDEMVRADLALVDSGTIGEQ